MRLVGTRNRGDQATFREVALGRVPASGGLFLPERWPVLPDVDDLLALPWLERCNEILNRLIGDEFSPAEITDLVSPALDIPLPVIRLQDGTFVLELFHGPTLAFKDFGARFLAAVLELMPAAGPRMVLTATSGDTGAAVARAFWKEPGIRAAVLYPAGRVSPSQESQFATLGENVLALAVEGSFDDCQALVKSCFADGSLAKELGLISANSINFVRLLAQSLYYFEGVAKLRQLGIKDTPVIAVPSGNFGNLCAGLLAQDLGLKVKCFVVATNANTTVPDYLDSGVYRPRRSVPTFSNAMDVGAPSNWERIDTIFKHDLQSLRGALRWGSCDDVCTADELRSLLDQGYLACPHTAVGHSVLRSRLLDREIGLVLSTAHPAKFSEVLQKAINVNPPLPQVLVDCMASPNLSESMPNDLTALKNRLRVTA